jgi:hypothetical protein
MDNKKITLEQLIARKQQSQNDKLEYKEVYVKELGGTLTLKKLPLNVFLGITDNYKDIIRTSQGSLEYYKELVYKFCPILQDKKLQEAYADKIAEPYDIVTAIFNDNMKAIAYVAEKAGDFYGLNESISEAKKETKN